MKHKLTTLDIKEIVTELRNSLLTRRVLNIYDISNKLFLFKFQALESSSTEFIPKDENSILKDAQQKQVLMIESGIRIHLSTYTREIKDHPNGFCMKLRKHIKGKRLSKIEQFGMDKVIDLTFGYEALEQHLILEFYSAGNVILTDADYKILSLLRPAEDVYQVHEKYPMDRIKTLLPLTDDLLESLKEKAKESKFNLKKFLNQMFQYDSAVIENLLVKHQQDVSKKVIQIEDWQPIYEALKEAHTYYLPSSQTRGGYLYFTKESEEEEEEVQYQDFQPFPVIQPKPGYQLKTFLLFNECLDEYFSKIEHQKLHSQLNKQNQQYLNKHESIYQSYHEQLNQLLTHQSKQEQLANLILANRVKVDACLDFIKNMITSGMDWKRIGKCVEEEKIKGNEHALLIHQLQLPTNQVSLLLSPESDFESESESDLETGSDSKSDDFDSETESEYRSSKPEKKAQSVLLDLSLNAHGNARKYFSSKKQTREKHEKAEKASHKAIQSSLQKLEKDHQLKTKQFEQQHQKIQKLRKVFWFEKFNWFLSSDNYLCLSGRDAQQNEQLVGKYLGPNDLYLHSETHGSTSIIIKNPTNKTVPLQTIREAVQMCTVYSKSWNQKQLRNRVYYVKAEQVSKSAPSGEYLTSGSFMIRGKRTYLEEHSLVYGLGLMFKISDEDVVGHLLERRPYLRGGQEIDEKIVLEEEGEEEVIKEEPEEEIKPKTKYISAKQRKDLKKKNVGNEEESIKEVEKPKVVEKQKEKQQQPKRGQRGKLKKLKQKYRDQFDEEKINHHFEKLSELSLEEENKEKEQEKLKEENKQNEEKETAEKSKEDQESDSEEEEEEEKVSDSEMDIKANQLQKEDKDNEPEVEEEELKIEQSILPKDDKITFIDTLTGNPLATDKIQFVFPVCAPVSALSSFKYKVKLQPGSVKKGKAGNLSQRIFTQLIQSEIDQQENMTENQKQLEKEMNENIKEMLTNVSENEWTQIVLGNVKIITPQGVVEEDSKQKKKKGTASKQSSKKKKK